MIHSTDIEVIHLDDISTSLDGVHLSPEGHRQMAIAVEEKIKEML